MSTLHNHFKEIWNKAINSANNAYEFMPPEDWKLYKKCCDEFKKRKYLKILKMEYEMNEAFKDLKTIEDNTIKRLKEYKADKRLDRYIFLTISPPEECLLKDMKSCIEKAVKRKFIKQYHYVYEQRGTKEKNVGKGKHLHLLFERDINYKPSTIKRDLKNTFKKKRLEGASTITQQVAKNFLLTNEVSINRNA